MIRTRDQKDDVADRPAKRARTSGSKSNGTRGVALAAGALSTVSGSLGVVAEQAGTAGLALRDRGRDAAKALSRGERLLREGGIPAAAVGAGILARRHARTFAVLGVAVLTWLTVRHLSGND